MNDRNAEILRCCWPGCRNAVWVAKNFEVCGGHARFVLDRMMGEARQRIDAMRGPGTFESELLMLREENGYLREALRRKEAPRNTPKDGTVYILRCGGFAKIGWTSDLAKRMRAYQPDTVLLATMPGTRKDENALHKRFAHLRTHGREWYSLAPQITEYVGILVAEHGQPDSITFAAKPVTVPRPHSSSRPTGESSTRLARAV